MRLWPAISVVLSSGTANLDAASVATACYATALVLREEFRGFDR
jgi:hypothetical protein